MSQESLEHIKKWCLQDQSALSARQVADAVVRMIDDLCQKPSAAEHLLQTTGGQTCPFCGGDKILSIEGTPYEEMCSTCKGTGQINPPPSV